MNDRSLIDIASQMREGVLDGRESTGMCAAVSYALEGYLSALTDVQCRCVDNAGGYFATHTYILLGDGRILDPTADQFGGPEVYLGQPLNYHYFNCQPETGVL